MARRRSRVASLYSTSSPPSSHTLWSCLVLQVIILSSLLKPGMGLPFLCTRLMAR